MAKMIQGSWCDEHGDPIDYEWENFQRELREDRIASIPLLKPAEQNEPKQEENER